MERPANHAITRPRIIIPEAPRLVITEATGMEQHHQHQSNDSTVTNATIANMPGFFVYPETYINEGITACKRSILGMGYKHRPKINGFHSCPCLDSTLGITPTLQTKKMWESIGKLIGQVEAAEFYEFLGKKDDNQDKGCYGCLSAYTNRNPNWKP
ncbi:hypothetical protein TSUD_293230 [Trifolium subterraneum]|uniref:Uncharacterized protein n=1 Tax=Trifolium subterraneum TaxID=3900 RepID=A0A2Z6MAL1_TRISU|nr:hypothetical protein TSUD_293230 [Trifolium subterraneum]